MCFVSSVHFHMIDFPAPYVYLCCSCLVQPPCFSRALYNVVQGCKMTSQGGKNTFPQLPVLSISTTQSADSDGGLIKWACPLSHNTSGLIYCLRDELDNKMMIKNSLSCVVKHIFIHPLTHWRSAGTTECNTESYSYQISGQRCCCLSAPQSP